MKKEKSWERPVSMVIGREQLKEIIPISACTSHDPDCINFNCDENLCMGWRR